MIGRLKALLSLPYLITGVVLGSSGHAANDFEGVWESQFGIMTLERDGGRIIGTYSCCEGTIEGTTEGNRLTFRWRDRLYGTGTGRFDLRDDARALEGTWGRDDDPAGGGQWSAVRIAESPDPPGDRSHWLLSVVGPVPTSPQGASATIHGTADLFFDGRKVAGHLSGHLSYSDAPDSVPKMEVFNVVTGTLDLGRLSLRWTNPNDRSSGTMDLSGDGNRYTGALRAEDNSLQGTVSLIRQQTGRTETLTEQAWVRHQRLWRLARANDSATWANPMSGDPRFAAMNMLNTGDPVDAAAAFAQLAKAYRAAGDIPHLADALNGEAAALRRLGRLEDARQRLHEILNLKGIDESVRVIAASGLATIDVEIGGSKLPDPLSVPEIKLSEDDPITLKDKASDALRSGDIDAAVAFYDRAIAGYKAKKEALTDPIMLHAHDISIAGVLQYIALAEFRRGRLKEAEDRLERAIAVWQQVEGGLPNTASAMGSLSVILQKQNRLPEAVAAITEAIAIAQANQVGDRWRLHGQRARLAVQMADDQAAATHFEQVAKLVEDLRTGLVTDETKIIYFGSAADLYEDYVAFLMERRGDPRAALAAAERSRARALLDTLDPEGKGLAPDYAFSAETASTITSATITAAEAVALARADHTAYLVYFVTSYATYAWLITPDGHLHSGRIDIDAAGLTKAIDDFRTPIIWGEPSNEPRRALTRLLSEPLVVVLSALPDGTRVTVVPHKRLSLVPFAALGETLGEWGKTWNLTILPSLSVARRLAQNAVPQEGPLLAVGAPAGSQGLVASTSEVTRAAVVFPNSTVLIGVEATRQRVLAELQRHRIALLSTHTRERDKSDTGRELELELAAPDGLARRDLKRGSLTGMNLVVLSACETVEGPQYAGDELMNLARAFLVAGAERVLITLWKAEDRASADVMSAFLTKVHHGTSPAVALRQVMTDYQERILPDGTRPPLAAWAPWVLVARHDGG